MRFLLRLTVFVVLTFLTQVGGIAYLFALMVGRLRLVLFLTAYAGLSYGATQVAPDYGRVPLPCLDGMPQLASPLYCVLNRHYVTPEMRDVLIELSRDIPETRVLDASFPFLDGFPLLPHLSHDDGEKVDLALYYQGPLRSPIGYFAFEEGSTECPRVGLPLRWDLAWLQPFFPETPLDEAKTREAMLWLAGDPRVDKIFLEPHLRQRLGLQNTKIRFQGCRAARHDDHIHFQL